MRGAFSVFELYETRRRVIRCSLNKTTIHAHGKKCILCHTRFLLITLNLLYYSDLQIIIFPFELHLFAYETSNNTLPAIPYRYARYEKSFINDKNVDQASIVSAITFDRRFFAFSTIVTITYISILSYRASYVLRTWNKTSITNVNLEFKSQFH